MSSLIDARAAFVAALEGAAALSGVTIYTHGGEFTLAELQRFARLAPALVLSLSKFTADIEAGIVCSTAHWTLVGFTRDTTSVARDVSCVSLIESATAVMLRTAAGSATISGVASRARDAKARNLYTLELDRATNIAMWGVEFEQHVDLVETISTDVWSQMHVDYDLYPRDNAADLGDVIDASDDIDPSA
jgi:hypothetical protein